MEAKKQALGGPLRQSGRRPSLSTAVRAGDFIFLTVSARVLAMRP